MAKCPKIKFEKEKKKKRKRAISRNGKFLFGIVFARL
jgi:hypothetical protein